MKLLKKKSGGRWAISMLGMDKTRGVWKSDKNDWTWPTNTLNGKLKKKLLWMELIGFNTWNRYVLIFKSKYM